MMTEVVASSSVHAVPEKVEPDYFGYYIREVQGLLSQTEDLLYSLSPEVSLPSSSNDFGKVKLKNVDTHNHHGNGTFSANGSGSLFSNAIGDGLSDFKRESLKATLRQSVIVLSNEVDEMADPVLKMLLLKKLIWEKEHLAIKPNADGGDVNQPTCKKKKISLSYSSNGTPDSVGSISLKFGEKLDEDMQLLIDNRGPQTNAVLEKHSDELSAQLKKLEQELEQLLYFVTSKCRQMSLAEKEQLQKQIKELPPKNLHHVFEIVQRRRFKDGQPCNEIHVDLEKEDNGTLWRLFFYVKAVASARNMP